MPLYVNYKKSLVVCLVLLLDSFLFCKCGRSLLILDRFKMSLSPLVNFTKYTQLNTGSVVIFLPLIKGKSLTIETFLESLDGSLMLLVRKPAVLKLDLDPS
uniref:Uncharacterized protein n=1 Tax=Opuntia streptacantha TaxID=393608 RepID=A0A7C9DVX5_OPUST